MTTARIATPRGPARAELHCAPEGRAALLLGHGAGGGIGAPDLVAATRGATAAGVHVALVEQPYRVAGRRAPAPAGQLDEAWLAVADDLSERWFADLPLVFGGRSSGARVACRTATEGEAVAVLCLAFPLHPPGKPEKTRLPELSGVDVPVLVVQGEKDTFGRPEPAHHREVVLLAGDHSLKADAKGISQTVQDWLSRVLRPLD
ncbi:putative alpha/beta-hydrolase family hydrolase [Kibdelosporangium banguiense]|uniref:Alpha/beta-hydrolase family hydrolase n=1 Tax=Kibdelosporangium banguiense TaxID=1365924 RepID=A0ABS4TEP6_9PSEU|nr:alpha/beta family hydrolase [Kibdelosporangium banguiense]MBP2322891.1 putative alpha/beta-hydrolase family hydrolase [Kibdelosporangium banguiense]